MYQKKSNKKFEAIASAALNCRSGKRSLAICHQTPFGRLFSQLFYSANNELERLACIGIYQCGNVSTRNRERNREEKFIALRRSFSFFSMGRTLKVRCTFIERVQGIANVLFVCPGDSKFKYSSPRESSGTQSG